MQEPISLEPLLVLKRRYGCRGFLCHFWVKWLPKIIKKGVPMKQREEAWEETWSWITRSGDAGSTDAG